MHILHCELFTWRIFHVFYFFSFSKPFSKITFPFNFSLWSAQYRRVVHFWKSFSCLKWKLNVTRKNSFEKLITWEWINKGPGKNIDPRGWPKSLFSHRLSVRPSNCTLYRPFKLFKVKKKNHLWLGLWDGRVDHSWLLSCLFCDLQTIKDRQAWKIDYDSWKFLFQIEFLLISIWFWIIINNLANPDFPWNTT